MKSGKDPNAHYTDGIGAATYDLFCGGETPSGDLAFYRDCADRFGGPILELGAGTGRVAMALAEAGHKVTGVELSSAMLETATAKLSGRPDLADRVRFIRGDMADFSFGERFATTIIAARSFQHVVTAEGQRATLAAVHRHLQSGGHLVLDLFDPRLDILSAGAAGDLPSRTVPCPKTGHTVRRTITDRQVDPMLQTIAEILLFEEIDTSGKVVRTEETSWCLRWPLRQEMRYLLELTGFQVVDEFSDFRGSPPDYGREQLWVARAV